MVNETLDDLRQRLSGWKASLILTPTKTPKAILANALIALRGAEEWQGVLAFNEFKLQIDMLKPPPWRKSEDNSWTPQPWADHEDTLTAEWLQHNDICVQVNVAAAAAIAVAKDNSVHPVLDYLAKLEWDKVQRVEHFASKYLGAEDTQYHQNVSECTLVGAVARIMKPGCKADHVLILEGPQGIGKSTAVANLFAPWFSDEIADLGSKDAAMQMSGVWCIELAELSSMTRSEIERMKAFISRRSDRFRPSYGRHVIEVPRQAVFIGTTNADGYLRDETGGRRFWPVQCGKINSLRIKRDRDQLWAEAVALYNIGAHWWLDDDVAIEAARDKQDERYLSDAWQEPIEKYIENKQDVSLAEIFLTVLDIVDKARWGRAEQMRISQCLRAANWVRYRTTERPRKWRYRRGPNLS